MSLSGEGCSVALLYIYSKDLYNDSDRSGPKGRERGIYIGALQCSAQTQTQSTTLHYYRYIQVRTRLGMRHAALDVDDN